MIIFNNELKSDELRDFTTKNIEPLFKWLHDQTANGSIQWKKPLTNRYSTFILHENENWKITLDNINHHLIIEWASNYKSKTCRYKETSRQYVTKYHSLNYWVMELNNRISTGPEILSDCIDTLVNKKPFKKD